MRRRDLNLQDNEIADESGEIRLQTFLSHSGVASRRASEKIILSGRVKVNGEVVSTLGKKVKMTDEVTVDDKKIALEENFRYILLNKPAGYVCSLFDKQGRPLAVDLLKEKYHERLYNVGRLDMPSQGLIIFTNDGEFARKLSHPSSELEKEYIVDSFQILPKELAKEFEKGIRVDDVFYKAKKAEEINPRRMRIILSEGKNREIRNVFKSKKIGIKKLMRVRIGCVEMNELPVGEFRELTAREVEMLMAYGRE